MDYFKKVETAAGPHRGSFLRHSTGPAPHVTTQALVKGSRPTPCMAHSPTHCHSQGDPRLRQSLGPLEITPFLPEWHINRLEMMAVILAFKEFQSSRVIMSWSAGTTGQWLPS